MRLYCVQDNGGHGGPVKVRCTGIPPGWHVIILMIIIWISTYIPYYIITILILITDCELANWVYGIGSRARPLTVLAMLGGSVAYLYMQINNSLLVRSCQSFAMWLCVGLWPRKERKKRPRKNQSKSLNNILYSSTYLRSRTRAWRCVATKINNINTTI